MYQSSHNVRLLSFKLVSLCVALCIILTGCFSFVASPVERTDKLFSEIVYERPDSQSILDKIEEVTQKIQNDFFPFSTIGLLSNISTLEGDFSSMYTIAMIRNYTDVTDAFYKDEVEVLSNESTKIETAHNEMFLLLLDSKFGSFMEWLWGEESVENMRMQSETSSPSILSLQEEENKLISDYFYQYAQATIEVDGEDQLYSSLSIDEQMDYRYDFYQKYNPLFGELFLKLVKIREEIATTLGFDDYSEIADLAMLRTCYDREDIQQFRDNLKTYLAPLSKGYSEAFFQRVEDSFSNNSTESLYLLGEPLPHTVGSWEDNLENLRTMFQKMSEETGECFNYMYDHEFIEVAPSPNKANIVFSTSLYSYNTPYIFANFVGDSQDISYFTHEFGHSIASFRQQELGVSITNSTMDISEIHSQSMELLSIPYYDIFYGEDADIATEYAIYNILSTILSAASSDEFQEIVYQNPEMTVDELNDTYGQLMIDYGISVDSPYESLELDRLQWFETNQFFDSPFYAIDYSLSGCVALEFLELMDEDYDQALSTYFSLIEQSTDYDFLTVLEESGLASPFDPQQLDSIAESVKKKLGDPFAQTDSNQIIESPKIAA